MESDEINMAMTDKHAIDKLATCNVLVVGDVMLDRYWFGHVDRISPEAPVPVVAVDMSEERIGGAGNVAANITALGGKCALLSVVGDDEAGHKVGEIATRSNIAHHLVVDQSGQTTIKLRLMSRNQQLLRADFESSPGAQVLDEVIDGYARMLEQHQVVLLSDYGKGGLDKIETMIEMAAKKNIPVLVDPKGSDFSRYHGAAMVTPNLKEFERVVGTVADDDDMYNKANELMQQHRLDKLLVTMSDRGMVLFAPERDAIYCQTRAREVYDVSGAGDTVIAVMAMAMAVEMDDQSGLNLANSAASVVVSKLGTAAVSKDELKAAIEQANRDQQR